MAVAGAVMTPSFAQTLDEVIVTAQKREQNLQDVTASVTVLSGDQLKEFGVVTTDDVVDLTPGLTMFASLGEDNTPNFALRGVSSSDISTVSEAPIAVYADEIYYGTQFGAMAQLYDMERFEALRGPQGTLFGRNATGGLLHFVTRKPEIGETSGYMNLTYGDNSEVTFEGAANIALGQQWAVRLSGATQRHDGYVHNRFVDPVTGRRGLDPNDTDKSAGRFQLGYTGQRSRLNINVHTAKDDSLASAWQIVGGENLDANGNVIVLAQDSIGQTFTAADGQTLFFRPENVDSVTTQLLNPQGLTGDTLQAYAESIAIRGVETRRNSRIPVNFGLFGGPYVDDDNDPFAGEYNFTGPLRTDNTGGWIRYEYDINDDLTVITLADTEKFSQVYFEDTDFSPVDDIRAFFAGTNEQSALELRLQGRSERLPSYVVGAYYYERKVIEDQGANVILPTLLDNAGISPPQQVVDNAYTEAGAIFGQLDFALGKRLILTAGLRYTSEKTSQSTGRGNVDACLFANVSVEACRAARANVGNDVTLSGQGVLIDLMAWQSTIPTLENSFNNFTGAPNYSSESHSLSDDFATGVLKLAYDLSDDRMLYGSYSQGSKSGGVNTSAQAVAILGTNAFDRETLNSLEFGYRSEFSDGRMRFNATLYDYDYEGYHAIQTLAPGVSGTINADANITGAEADYWATLGEHWSLSFSTALIFDSSVDDIRDNFGNVRTRKMKLAPDWQFNGFVRYGMSAWGGELTAQLNFAYTDEYYSFLDNLDAGRVPAYHLFGGSVSWRSPSEMWVLQLSVKNLTNRKILQSAFDFVESDGYGLELYQPPRWASLSFGIEF